MFNRNGKNNGNGVHNGAAVASRNGNGHKPDAAPASSAGQAIPAEHELLWDGLSPTVTEALGQPLDPELVSQRKGRGGKDFDYLEGHIVIEQANRIFGRGGWGYEQVGDVTLRRIETVDTQTGEVTVSQAYSATVRVTVAGALPRTDSGFHPVTEETADGHDTALKAAVTDGMKRAFRSFGVQFGNGFYGDQSPPTAQPRPRRVPAPANGNSRQPQPKSPVRQAQSLPSTGSRGGRNESCVLTLRKRVSELATKQGFDEEQVRAAVRKQTGKDLDELTAAELGPLVKAAAKKLQEMQREKSPSRT